MVARVLGGVTNAATGIVNGLLSGPGKSAEAPGHGGSIPPGLNHAPAEVQARLADNYAPQNSPKPVDIQTRPSGPRGTPEVTGRKGPAGNDPWISQYSPDGADSTYTNGAENCAPTVAAMVARNVGYGKDLNDAQLIQDLATVGGTDGTGTSGNGLVAMFEHLGLDTNAAVGADLNWIQSELQSGHHVTTLGDFYEVPGRIDPALTSGHYIDITGLDKDGNFLVNDPADPNVTMMTAAQLQTFISSAPGGGFAISAWKPTGPG